MQIKQHTNKILLKDVNSLELLLEEVSLHLHIDHKDLAPEKQRVIENLRSCEDVLSGKTILVVDDDVRNLFALTTAFERYNINAITAETEKKPLIFLQKIQAWI